MSFTKKHLLPGETIITLVHPHPVVLLKPILLVILVAVVCGYLFYYASPWFLLILLAPLAYLFGKIVVRNSQEYIVTDHRVVRQEGILSKSSFDASLDKINNVFHEQSLLGRIFKFGTVGLETASEQGTTVFDLIPDPVQFKNNVVRQCETYRRSFNLPDANAPQDVPRMLNELASLRDRNIISSEEFESKKKSLLDKI
jgi:uncharacterized membrane protein YdbT with pleckstrin-like domain